MNNKTRVQSVEIILPKYLWAKGECTVVDDDTPADLLADVLHYIRQRSGAAQAVADLRRAIGNYEVEARVKVNRRVL